MAKGSSSTSPKVATISQVCETGCSSRLYRRILNFGQGQATKRLVSNARHSNIHALENGNSGSRQHVLTTVDQKYSHNHTKVSSKRKDYFGCKSISCVKNYDQVATVHQGNEATNNKVVARNLIKGKYMCKDGAISQPHQFLDALQIYYSNKPLFLKLVQDKTSLSVKDQHQAGQKMLARSDFESKWINSQRSHASQCESPSAGFHCSLHSPGTHSYNVPSVKHLYFPFSHTKRKSRHAIGVGKKDGDEAKGLENVGRKSASSVHSSFAKGKLSLDFKEREKMKIRDFMLCRGQNDVSVRESGCGNIIKASVNPSLQNIQNKHVEVKENQSEVLNCRIEGQNNNEPGGDAEKSPPDKSYAYNGIPTDSEELIKSGHDSHPKGTRHMDDVSSDQDRRDMDDPTQSFDADSTIEENGFVMDSPNVVEDLSSSPEVSSSSSSSSCQNVEEVMDMTNMVDDNLNTESTTEQVISFSSDLVDNLITSMDTSESNFNREILQALCMKWDELVINCELPDQLMYISTLEELKGLTNQLSGSIILFDYVMEVFKEKYQNLCGFPHHISIGKPNMLAYVLKRTMVHEVEEFMDLHHHQNYLPKRTLEQLLEHDLARRRSWLDVQVDIDDIATEVQEDVLQELIFEITSEKDYR